MRQKWIENSYSDIDNVDNIENCMEALDSALYEIERFKDLKDTYIAIECIKGDLQVIFEELDEKRTKVWAGERAVEDREYLASRGIAGLVF